jgi:hypothetical protein
MKSHQGVLFYHFDFNKRDVRLLGDQARKLEV